jgi:hypothetical protein
MPYIGKHQREKLEHARPAGSVGELTYCIQQELLKYIQLCGLTYQTLAECLGALEGAKADLIERVLKPYESNKRTENGDVWSLYTHPRWLGDLPKPTCLEGWPKWRDHR